MYKSFTLIEILISVAIFMFVLLSFPAFLSSIFASEFRAIAIKKLADDTRAGLEIMGREMRLAKKATPALNCTLPIGNSFTIQPSGQEIAFIDFDGSCIIYTFDSSTKTILKKIDANPAQLFLGDNIGGNIKVSNAKFNLINAGANQQPRVTVQINVEVKDPTKQGAILSIPLQTTISQRQVNLIP